MILRMRAWRRSSGAQRAAVLGLLLLVVLWLPGTLAGDVRGLRSALAALGARARRGDRARRAGRQRPRAAAARARDDPGGRPVSPSDDAAPGASGARATAREPVRSWTQFALAPRAQVARRAARWVLVLGSTPRAAGIATAAARVAQRPRLARADAMRSLAGLLGANALLALLGSGALLATGTWDRLRPASRIGPALLAGFALAVGPPAAR